LQSNKNVVAIRAFCRRCKGSWHRACFCILVARSVHSGQHDRRRTVKSRLRQHPGQLAILWTHTSKSVPNDRWSTASSVTYVAQRVSVRELTVFFTFVWDRCLITLGKLLKWNFYSVGL